MKPQGSTKRNGRWPLRPRPPRNWPAITGTALGRWPRQREHFGD